jgi:8-oxo-dGTP pyrophosphatase MutT (NUDIX family)
MTLADSGSLEQIRSRLCNLNLPLNSKVKKRASVLIPLRQIDGELHLLFTQRASHLNSHSGQVSFPGGKQDPQDRSALETVLRECEEEIGLAPEQVECLGQIDQIISLYHYLVTPFVAIIASDFISRPNSDEINAVFEVPLSFFLNPTHHTSEEISYEYPRLSHHFLFGNYDIWGMTAKLVIRFLELGIGYVPEYPIHHHKGPNWLRLAQRFTGQPHKPSQ